MAFRDSSGSNYCICVQQLYHGLKLQRLKLYKKLEISDKYHKVGDADCCVSVHDSGTDFESGFEESSSISELEKSALYYISGYVAFKENISVRASELETDESEFFEEVSRGRLGHPPATLYDLSLYKTIFISFWNNLILHHTNSTIFKVRCADLTTASLKHW